MANLNSIKRPEGVKRPYRRVGRGQSSTRGKQSGRGGKGQTARAGHKIRPALRDIIKKLPKRRGYGKNRGRTVVPHLEPIAVPVGKLNTMFENGAEVNGKSFLSIGIITARKPNPIKIVSGGELTKKLTITGVAASASAKAAIEKAGGSINP